MTNLPLMYMCLSAHSTFTLPLSSAFIATSSVGIIDKNPCRRSSVAAPTCSITSISYPSTSLQASRAKDDETAAQSEMQRTAERLAKLQQLGNPSPSPAATASDANTQDDPYASERQALFEECRMRPANDLKTELKSLHLKATGRKPDLARRLADYYIATKHADDNRDAYGDGGEDDAIDTVPAQQVQSQLEGDDGSSSGGALKPLTKFAGLVELSEAAGTALARAQFTTPSPIQAAAIPTLVRGQSCILHAETGSGKTLTYLLPITELMWKESEMGMTDPVKDGVGFAIILTPTRELAAQVAGVATVLAPPGSVRLISHPTNLMRNDGKERGEAKYGGRIERDSSAPGAAAQPRLIIGSAKAVMTSLFGNSKMPAPPTSKPEAKLFLDNVKWVVMDEVDRLLNVKKTRSEKAYKKHEKPAAILTSAVARYTLGKAQIVAASATVGRPLRRELSRVLGLPASECPPVIRGKAIGSETETYCSGTPMPASRFSDITGDEGGAGTQLGRLVTIPPTVQNYVVPSLGDSSGQLLTTAASIIKNLPKRSGADGDRARRVLLVLSKGCELSVRNALGALQHFQCDPPPRALIDVLEADGTDRMIEVHRKVSGATGVGQSMNAVAPKSSSTSASLPSTEELEGMTVPQLKEELKARGKNVSGRKADLIERLSDSNSDNVSGKTDDEGYIYVTGEDSVRGLHLDELDTVICVGRPRGPDEYTHIAGRTGRAGKAGTVINVVTYEQATALTSWEKMLKVDFIPLEEEEVSSLR